MPNKNGELGNVYLTDDIIAKEALRRLENKLIAARFVNRSLEPQFGKIGDIISVKKPFRTKSAEGRVLVKQPMVDQTIPFKIDRQRHVGFEFTVRDRRLSIEDFGNQYLDAGVAELAHHVDLSIWQAIAAGTFNTTGVAGTGATYEQFLDANAAATMLGHPDDGKTIIGMNPLDAASHLKELVRVGSDRQKQSAIERAYVGNIAGMDAFQTAQIPVATLGVGTGTPLVNGATQSGGTLVTDGWTASTTGILKAGNVFTIAGVYSVNPMTRLSTGALQQFVVLQDTNSAAAGATTIKIWPEMNDGTATTTDAEGSTVSLAAYQNVTNLPADNAPITLLKPATGTTYRQNFMVHKDAAMLVMVDSILPSTASVAQTKRSKSGISLALTADYDINEHSEVYRLDAIWGVHMMYPELSHRILGKAA